MTAQLVCKDLSPGYDSKSIIENINFSVNSGDYLFIVGENGSGKSTLMKTILGLQPPVSGEVIFGNGISKNQIGYLPQQSDFQKDFPASVKEIIISGCCGRMGNKPFYGKAEKQRAEKAAEKLGIKDFYGKCYRELSGGQQQRVLLARALCAADKMLLLDEPVSGLDPKAASDMYETVEKLNREYKMTVIMISHDINAAALYATHILHIGKNVFFGTKDEYMNTHDCAFKHKHVKGGAE